MDPGLYVAKVMVVTHGRGRCIMGFVILLQLDWCWYFYPVDLFNTQLTPCISISGSSTSRATSISWSLYCYNTMRDKLQHISCGATAIQLSIVRIGNDPPRQMHHDICSFWTAGVCVLLLYNTAETRSKSLLDKPPKPCFHISRAGSEPVLCLGPGKMVLTLHWTKTKNQLCKQ